MAHMLLLVCRAIWISGVGILHHWHSLNKYSRVVMAALPLAKVELRRLVREGVEAEEPLASNAGVNFHCSYSERQETRSRR